MSVAGAVLCGGLSSRMGRPKALLPWQGTTLVEHMVSALRPVVDRVLVISSEALALPGLDASVVVDREPELGPLGAIREALAAATEKRVVVVATDAPFLTREFLAALLDAGDVVAARDEEGIVQPLVAVYPTAGSDTAQRMVEAGVRKPMQLLEELGVRPIDPEALPRVQSLRGFNTPESYLSAVRSVEPEAKATVEFFGRPRLAVGARRRQARINALGALLEEAAPEVTWLEDGKLSREFLISLDGRAFVRNTSLPVGPGETVIALDAPAGG